MNKTEDIKKQLKNLSDDDGYIGYYEARDFLQSNLPDLDEFDLDNAMEDLEPDYSNYEDEEVFYVLDVENKYDELKQSYAKGGEVEKHYKIEFLDENEEIIDVERYGNTEPDQDDYYEMASKLNAFSGIVYSYDEDDEDGTLKDEGFYETDFGVFQYKKGGKISPKDKYITIRIDEEDRLRALKVNQQPNVYIIDERKKDGFVDFLIQRDGEEFLVKNLIENDIPYNTVRFKSDKPSVFYSKEPSYAKGGSVSTLKTEYIKFLKDNDVDVDKLKFRYRKVGTYGDEEIWTHDKKSGRSGFVITRDDFESIKKDDPKDFVYGYSLPTKYAKGGMIKVGDKVVITDEAVYDEGAKSNYGEVLRVKKEEIYDGAINTLVEVKTNDGKINVVNLHEVNKLYAKGGMVNKNDKDIFTKHAKVYLKQFYDNDDIPNIIETDYLPNLKKIDEKTYSVEYPGGAGYFIKEEFELTKRSLKMKNTYEKSAKGKSDWKIVENFAKGGEIDVVDERSVGKMKIIVLNDGKNSRTITFKDGVQNKFNRNKKEDIEKLWDLSGKVPYGTIVDKNYKFEHGGSILEKSYNPQEVFDMITQAGTWEEFMSADGDGRLEIFNNAKYRFEKGGKTISREEVVEVLKDKLEDVLEDANQEYEGQEITGEEVEYESRDGFIPYTDGGYQYEFFTYENYLTGSGTSLPTITLQEELSRREKMLYEEAQEDLWNQEKDEEGFRDKFPTPESINWNDLEDYDYELAETFDDLSRAYDDSIRFEVEALYYKPDNDKSIDGKHTIVLSGSVNMETPYHRRGNMEDFIEEKFTFDSIKDLEDKLDKFIPKIEAWFDGDNYKQGKELKMGRFKKGGKITESNLKKYLNKMNENKFYDTYEEMFDEDWEDENESRKEATKTILDYLFSLDDEMRKEEMVRIGYLEEPTEYAKGGKTGKYKMYDYSDSFDEDEAEYIDNEFQLFDTNTGKYEYPNSEDELLKEIRKGRGKYRGKIVKYYEIDGEQFRKEELIGDYAKGGKTTQAKYYTYDIVGDKVHIYQQNKEDENSFDSIEQIITQLKKEGHKEKDFVVLKKDGKFAKGGYVTSRNIKESVREYLMDKVPYVRKPGDLEEVNTVLDFTKLPDDVKTAILNMKKIVVRDDEDLSFFKSRLDGDIQFYILFIKGEPYLVDTQGYDYARYIVRIVGAGEELSVKFSNYVEYTPYARGGMTGPLKLAITPNEFSPKVEEVLDEYGVEYRLDPDYEQLHQMGEGKMYIIDDYEEKDLEDAKKVLSMKREGVFTFYKGDDPADGDMDVSYYKKGGKVKSNNKEMIIGGLAGILFGFLLNK